MARPSREINIINMSMLDVICSALGAVILLLILMSQAQQHEQNRADDAERHLNMSQSKLARAMADLNKAITRAKNAEAAAKAASLEHQKAQKRAQEAQAQARAAQQAAARARANKLAMQIQAQNAERRAQQAQQRANQAAKNRDQAVAKARKAEAEAKKAKTKFGGPGAVIGMCNTNASSVTISTWDYGRVDGDRISLAFDDRVLSGNLSLTRRKYTRRLNLSPGGHYITIKALSEGRLKPNTAIIRISPCHGNQPDSFRWSMRTGRKRQISIVRQ